MAINRAKAHISIFDNGRNHKQDTAPYMERESKEVWTRDRRYDYDV